MDLTRVIGSLSIGERLDIEMIDTPGGPWLQIRFSKEYNGRKCANMHNISKVELITCICPDVLIEKVIHELIDQTREAF